MSLERRIERLEGRIEPPEDEGAQLRRALWGEILGELSRLKGARARGHYKGGNPPTPIQPTDPAGEILGYPYTHRQLVELAIRRVFERETEFSGKEADELITSWTEGFREQLTSLEFDWNQVECWAPPDPVEDLSE
jgi:hypothetical protein